MNYVNLEMQRTQLGKDDLYTCIHRRVIVRRVFGYWFLVWVLVFLALVYYLSVFLGKEIDSQEPTESYLQLT